MKTPIWRNSSTWMARWAYAHTNAYIHEPATYAWKTYVWEISRSDSTFAHDKNFCRIVNNVSGGNRGDHCCIEFLFPCLTGNGFSRSDVDICLIIKQTDNGTTPVAITVDWFLVTVICNILMDEFPALLTTNCNLNWLGKATELLLWSVLYAADD